jgi:hypothetical protein
MRSRGVPRRPRMGFGGLLHWEKRSRECCQCLARSEGQRRSRTLGGMRVERPRFCMKLILTAAAQLASIALSRRSGSVRATYQGGQDDGVEMEVVRSVVRFEEESCTTDYAGACAKQPPQLHPIASTSPTFPPATSTTPPPCLPYPGQLARDCLPPPCGPPRRGPSHPPPAPMRPTSPLPKAARRAPKMRPLSSSTANPPRSARKMLPRE